jgi:hypothetical protein
MTNCSKQFKRIASALGLVLVIALSTSRSAADDAHWSDWVDAGEDVNWRVWEDGKDAECIIQSSYLLDATRHNGLWFHQFSERNWLHLNGLLRQSIEQFAA